jgi:YD repeat-containing protein
MSVTIAGNTFSHHHYDPRGDVLYLSVDGYKGPPVSAFSTPEGHNVEYDDAGRVIGMTLVNVRWLLERDGKLTITWPAGQLSAEDLAPAMQTAA